MESFLEKIKTNWKDIMKIKVYNNTVNHRYLTWRICRKNIYMYDCGENYASVVSLHSIEELLDELRKGISNDTTEIVVKYTDEHKEFINVASLE